MDLLQFIEKPLKYISELTSQLAVLLSCTAVGHRDYVCLESVVSIFRTFEGEMKEMMNKLSNFEDLRNIETAFDEDEPYSNLETLQEKTLFTRGPKYWALLLSDCLILARRTEQGVLLVLDEPVMLRSIYQVTFDVMKCDTEFRVLFAVPNVYKATGQRNQWTTWILRTPCAGVKLLWQAILTHQLSLYSSEALTHGKKTSFVHAKPSLVLRGVLPKRNIKYEESSFVTCIQGPRAMSAYSKGPAYSDSTLTGAFRSSVEENSYLLIEDSSKVDKDKLRSLKLGKKEKEGSYFSLKEGSLKESHKRGVVRSKSFGNDFQESIPFIDCAEESNSGTESNIIYIREYVPEKKDDCDKPSDTNSVPQSGDGYAKSNVSDCDSVPSTPPKTADRLVQTDDSAESTEAAGAVSKRTPKKKFPRLGTFERIKIENKKSNSEDVPSTKECRTRTGTSIKHRRQISTTVSKEKLLRSESISPILDAKDETTSKELSPSVRPKYGKRYFGRFFKKSSSASGTTEKTDESVSKVEKENELTPKTESAPISEPNSETSVQPVDSSHVSLN
ncbi:uncharacterized protein CDAR_3181 [Caerostris darwini]|uniref:Uncharacterized protein n=1 Tax=Caerostris darwini TaxID=1538125 RepID=A0AAV4T0I2_9ARAC|nr:uncharacterized protein CDAR_3181 [Caerostris darwini]